MSLKLYRVINSNSIENIHDLEYQLNLDIKDLVDLYKVYEDLAIFLTNNPDPFDLVDSIELKTICGNFIDNLEIGNRNCIGFLTNSEIVDINNWIKSNQLDSKRGFLKYYNKLSDEVKDTLEDYGSDIEELYEEYFKILVKFYKSVQKGNNSVIFCSE